MRQETMIYGIQGGPGSFNDLALARHLEKNDLTAELNGIEYLYTTLGVLSALRQERIGRGQFATRNTIAGEVQETFEARSAPNFDRDFEIIEEYDLLISHSLMIHPKATLESITTLMTHEQVIKQCRYTLARRYPQLRCIEGDGDFKDPARVGRAIADGELPPTIATLSCEIISQKTGLIIVDSGMTDRDDNVTTFALVRLRGHVD